MDKAVQYDDVLAELKKDPDFRKARRQIKPYYDLLKDVLRRRKNLGITQKDLAERAGTHQSRISKIESGEHDIRLSTIITLAEALEAEVKIQLIPFEEKYITGEDYEILWKHLFGTSIQDVEEFSEEEIHSFPVRLEYA